MTGVPDAGIRPLSRRSVLTTMHLFCKLTKVKVRILGCYGGITPYHRTTSFLVNDILLLDAGTISQVLGRDEADKITHVFLSHAHLEHVKGLLPFTEDRFLAGQRGIVLGAIQRVLDVVSQHFFNDEVWPDFTRRPSPDAPVVSLLPLRMEERVVFDGVEVRPIGVSHSVACTGFCLKERDKGFMFTGDRGPQGGSGRLPVRKRE